MWSQSFKVKLAATDAAQVLVSSASLLVSAPTQVPQLRIVVTNNSGDIVELIERPGNVKIPPNLLHPSSSMVVFVVLNRPPDAGRYELIAKGKAETELEFIVSDVG